MSSWVASQGGTCWVHLPSLQLQKEALHRDYALHTALHRLHRDHALHTTLHRLHRDYALHINITKEPHWEKASSPDKQTNDVGICDLHTFISPTSDTQVIAKQTAGIDTRANDRVSKTS